MRNRLFYASRNPNSKTTIPLENPIENNRTHTHTHTPTRTHAQKKEKQKRKEKIKVTREIARNHTHCSESKNIPRNAFAVRPNTTRSFFVRD